MVPECRDPVGDIQQFGGAVKEYILAVGSCESELLVAVENRLQSGHIESGPGGCGEGHVDIVASVERFAVDRGARRGIGQFGCRRLDTEVFRLGEVVQTAEVSEAAKGIFHRVFADRQRLTKRVAITVRRRLDRLAADLFANDHSLRSAQRDFVALGVAEHQFVAADRAVVEEIPVSSAEDDLDISI